MANRAAPTRRSPYGDNPQLGALGSRARIEIVEAARGLFADHGYHGTTVELIAARAGRSGPAVYQYFENKGDLFRVLVNELGAELIAEGRGLGDLGGRGGRRAMEEFVSGLSAVSDAHRATAMDWTSVEQSEHRLRAPALKFLDAFAEQVRPRLDGLVPAAAGGYRPFAFAALSIVQWATFTRRSRMPDLEQDALDRYVAAFLHRVLKSQGSPARAQIQPRRPPSSAQEAPRPHLEASSVGLRKPPVTERSRRTVERILRAATAAFIRSGYAGATIQEIADAAHVGKATVYTYWVDQQGLFSTLAHQASVAIERLLADGVRSDLFDSDDRARDWLDRWLTLIRDHGAVLHIWTHEVIDDSALGPMAEQMYSLISADLEGLISDTALGRRADDAADSPHPGRILLWALLVEFPYTLSVQLPALDHAEVREVVLQMIRRGMRGER